MKNKVMFLCISLAVLGACNDLEMESPAAPDMLEPVGNDIVCHTAPLTKTSIGDHLQVVWDKDDEIVLVSPEDVEGKVYSVKEVTDDRRTAIFSADEVVDGEPRFAVYPADAFISFSADDRMMEVDLSGLNEAELSWTNPEKELMSREADVSEIPMVASSEGALFGFRNICGGIMVRPYDYQGIGLSVKSITVTSKDGKAIGGTAAVDMAECRIAGLSGSETSVTMTMQEPVDIGSSGWTSWSSHELSVFGGSAKGFVVYIPEGEYPGGFEVTVTDADGRGYSFDTGKMNIEGGKVTRLAYMPLTVYYGRANSVLVEPGTTSVDIDVTPYASFRNDFTYASRPVKSGTPVVASAEVLWQQEYDCPKTDLTGSGDRGTVVPSGASLALRQEDGRQMLTVPLTGTAGNAVVAVKDASGKTLWSFHIWVSEVADVECSNAAGGDYTIMDRNLGATSDKDFSQSTQQLVRNSFGMLYQWGRKDPFPRRLQREQRTAANAGADNVFRNSVTRQDKTIGNIGYTISNPDRRIWLSDSGCNWLMSYIGELWGFGYGNGDIDRLVEENVRTAGVKTVYDPCPEGYKVPDIRHLKGLLDENQALPTSERDRLYGYNLNTGAGSTYIPAAGYMSSANDDSSALVNEGYWGMLWSSAAALSNVFYFRVDAAAAPSFMSCVRGHLCSVRCLKIE